MTHALPVIAAEPARRMVLAKQHLLRRAPSSNWRTVPRSLVGIHAARFKSPIFSMAARVDYGSANAMATGLYRTREMIKIRCMRGTLHIVPTDFAHVFHAATWRQRRGVCERLARINDLADCDRDAVYALILEALSGSCLTSPQIEDYVIRRGAASKMSVRAAVKLLWESGRICYLNLATRWDTEDRRYGITDEHFALGAQALDEPEADRLLLKAYFTAYGPASLADAMWWSSLGRGRVSRAIAALPDLVEVEVAGEHGPHFAVSSELEQISSSSDKIPTVRLLAYEDNLLKGYMPSRRRFVSPSYFGDVFNAIGEARASVLVNGVVEGIWNWDLSTQRPSFTLFRKLSADEEFSLTGEADRLNCLMTAGA